MIFGHVLRAGQRTTNKFGHFGTELDRVRQSWPKFDRRRRILSGVGAHCVELGQNLVQMEFVFEFPWWVQGRCHKRTTETNFGAISQLACNGRKRLCRASGVPWLSLRRSTKDSVRGPMSG